MELEEREGRSEADRKQSLKEFPKVLVMGERPYLRSISGKKKLCFKLTKPYEMSHLHFVW